LTLQAIAPQDRLTRAAGLLGSAEATTPPPGGDRQMANQELIAKGLEMRRILVGKVMAEKLDREVYTDPHMQKFSELFNELIFSQVWPRGGIDLKTRTLITMVSDVTAGAHEALALHVRFCRIHGWSEDEIIECMIHLTAYVGIPLVRKAILVASKTFQEMRDNNELPEKSVSEAAKAG
jgi:alkylhydroperoxidase/carboxymuconolactone decarboxylase family protein YurZ